MSNVLPESPRTATESGGLLTSPRKTLALFAGVVALAIGIPMGIFLLVISAEREGGMLASRLRGSRILSNEMEAPPFTLTAQDGRSFSLENYRGRAVFLAFVPSLNDPETRAIARALKASTGDFDRAGAKVLMVSPDSPEAGSRLHTEEKLPFPLLTDADGSLARQYTVPGGRRTTFVVDPKGKIKYRIGDAMIEAERHGKQLIEISKCCMDDILAARAGGIGKPVGDYSLPLAASGAMETLFADGSQKATVVLFLSVKCPCSNAYNERVRELARRYSRQGIRFVGIYSNSDETAASLVEHARLNRFDFPVLRDENGLCADHFRATVTPQVFLVDRQRILRYAGRLDDDRDPVAVKTHDLEMALEAILSGGAMPEETRPFGCAIIRETPP